MRVAAELAPRPAGSRMRAVPRRKGVTTVRMQTQAQWAQTPEAFQRLLTWLDQGVESGGQTYLEMRRRLMAYFARKRCASPDELADEAFNRVARRLEEEDSRIDIPPAKYCYVVARFVFLEHLRTAEHPRRRIEMTEHLRQRAAPADSIPARAGIDRAPLDVLDECLRTLAAADHELILDYYRAQESTVASRRALAVRLGLTPNALAIRACRIRCMLEACMNASFGT
jgi:hypothetical protein